MPDPELKRKVEALLFSSGKKLGLDEISKACRAQPSHVQEALVELKQEYELKESSLMLVEEAGSWKITVREKFAPIARKVAAQAELPKSVVETLSVVAWKAPVLQSDVIKVRTNKAYDHLKLLEESGFITRKRYSRTQMINLTQKFYSYFDVVPDEVKAKFGKLKPKAETRVEMYEEKKPAASQGLEVYEEGAEPEARQEGEPVPMATGTANAEPESKSSDSPATAEIPEDSSPEAADDEVVEEPLEEQELEQPPEPVITADMSLKDQLAELDKASEQKKSRRKGRKDASSEMP